MTWSRTAPGTKLSPQERAVMEMREAHCRVREIARALGIRREAVYVVLARLRAKGVVPVPERGSEFARPQPELRPAPCIRCRQPFMSEGSHNRMCDECHRFADGLSAQFIGA